MHKYFPLGLLNWQWDVIEWTCVLCNCINHKTVSEYSSHVMQGFDKTSPRHVSYLKSKFGSLWLLANKSKDKITVESEIKTVDEIRENVKGKLIVITKENFLKHFTVLKSGRDTGISVWSPKRSIWRGERHHYPRETILILNGWILSR